MDQEPQDFRPVYFDRQGAVGRRQGAYLPHWTQEGVIYFVTLRLMDALPESVLSEWERERTLLLQKSEQSKTMLSDQSRARLRKLLSEKLRIILMLDAGHAG